jgi:hypothetical protein
MVAARSRALGLDPRPADVIAAERAEQARKAAAYGAAVSVLEAKLGPSWTIGCPTVAEALVEPHTLRVLLGVPHPGPGEAPRHCPPSSEGDRARADEIRLHCCTADLATALGLDPNDTTRGWPEALADVRSMRQRAAEDEALITAYQIGDSDAELAGVTAIDDTTPEGVLALLDAAIDALVRDDEAHLAESLIDERDGLAFELGGALRDDDRFNKRRVDQLAARLGLDRPRAPNALDAQVGALAPLDGARLLARFRRLAVATDEIIANPSDSGWSERQHLTMLAAICLALVAKLTADTTGGAF